MTAGPPGVDAAGRGAGPEGSVVPSNGRRHMRGVTLRPDPPAPLRGRDLRIIACSRTGGRLTEADGAWA